MKYTFEARLSVYIEVTDKEFDYIWEKMKHHYDATINSAIEVGGFMYGLRNRREPYPNCKLENFDKNLEVDSRKLGLILKSLETPHCVMDINCNLSKKFTKIMKTMCEKNMEINSSYEKENNTI